MLDWLISFGLHKRFLVVVAAACLLMCGTAGVKNNRLGVIPDLSPLSLTVKTESLGLSSAEVELLTTVPLEADLLNGVPWLQVIQSESMRATFDDQYDFRAQHGLVEGRPDSARAVDPGAPPAERFQSSGYASADWHDSSHRPGGAGARRPSALIRRPLIGG